MRHSVNIASSNYTRIDETKKSDEKPKTINVNVIGSKKEEGNDKSRMKEYYKNNKDKILKQQSDFYKDNREAVRAKKNVAYLNRNQSEPRKENIEKYKLEKRDGVWITLL
jgi:NAD(P)H-nitrite reductase large subunit